MADAASDMVVTVCWVDGPQVRRDEVRVPHGSCVADVLARAAVSMQHVLESGRALAVDGRRVALGDVLHVGDRLDVLAPLRVDPKVARRRRAQHQRQQRGRRLP